MRYILAEEGRGGVALVGRDFVDLGLHELVYAKEDIAAGRAEAERTMGRFSSIHKEDGLPRRQGQSGFGGESLGIQLGGGVHYVNLRLNGFGYHFLN